MVTYEKEKGEDQDKQTRAQRRERKTNMTFADL